MKTKGHERTHARTHTHSCIAHTHTAMNNRVGSNENLLIYYYGFIHCLFFCVSLLIHLNQNHIVSLLILRTQTHETNVCIHFQPTDWCCPMCYCLDHIWFHSYIKICLALFGDTGVVFAAGVFCFFNEQKSIWKRIGMLWFELLCERMHTHTHTFFFAFLSLVRLDVCVCYIFGYFTFIPNKYCRLVCACVFFFALFGFSL